LNRGPQDCNPSENPGGAYCCLVRCPAELPMTGSACTVDGGECGYAPAANACNAANCYCQSGAWNCEPTCVIPPNEDAAPDGPAGDAAVEAAADTGADAGAE
jgi:hypothetical protein